MILDKPLILLINTRQVPFLALTDVTLRRYQKRHLLDYIFEHRVNFPLVYIVQVIHENDTLIFLPQVQVQDRLGIARRQPIVKAPAQHRALIDHLVHELF